MASSYIQAREGVCKGRERRLERTTDAEWHLHEGHVGALLVPDRARPVVMGGDPVRDLRAFELWFRMQPQHIAGGGGVQLTKTHARTSRRAWAGRSRAWCAAGTPSAGRAGGRSRRGSARAAPARCGRRGPRGRVGHSACPPRAMRSGSLRGVGTEGRIDGLEGERVDGRRTKTKGGWTPSLTPDAYNHKQTENCTRTHEHTQHAAARTAAGAGEVDEAEDGADVVEVLPQARDLGVQVLRMQLSRGSDVGGEIGALLFIREQVASK